MSEETPAPEAEETTPAAPAETAETPDEPEAPAAPDAEPEAAEPEALVSPDASWGTDAPAEAPEGGLLGDNTERKPTAAPHEVKALRAGKSSITRDQLGEIKRRRAQADLATLIAACESLLDELGR